MDLMEAIMLSTIAFFVGALLGHYVPSLVKSWYTKANNFASEVEKKL